MSNMHPPRRATRLTPYMQAIYDRFCAPTPARGLPPGQEILLMTTTVDRWEMRRMAISGPHEGDMSMWSEPFAGGIAIAAHILSHPERFAGRTVLDSGAGSGLVAIAAAKAGATAIAVDSSQMACEAIATNAALNHVTVEIGQGHVEDPDGWVSIHDDITTYGELAAEADIVTAGDIFYDYGTAEQIAQTLLGFARAGKTVYASSGEEDLRDYFGKQVEVLDKGYSNRAAFVRLHAAPPAPPPPAKPAHPKRKTQSYTAQLTSRFARKRRPG